VSDPLYYLDTSALLKRYRTETGHPGSLLGQEDETLVTSHFSSLEVEAMASRALKGRILTRKAYDILLGLFAAS
jgi:hypothetical protein